MNEPTKSFTPTKMKDTEGDPPGGRESVVQSPPGIGMKIGPVTNVPNGPDVRVAIRPEMGDRECSTIRRTMPAPDESVAKGGRVGRPKRFAVVAFKRTGSPWSERKPLASSFTRTVEVGPRNPADQYQSRRRSPSLRLPTPKVGRSLKPA